MRTNAHFLCIFANFEILDLRIWFEFGVVLLRRGYGGSSTFLNLPLARLMCFKHISNAMRKLEKNSKRVALQLTAANGY